MIYGFEIVYKGNVPKVVYVYLEEGNKSAKYGVTLKASVVKKGVNKVKRYKDKGMIYLKKYGIKDVFERVEMKLSRKIMKCMNTGEGCMFQRKNS